VGRRPAAGRQGEPAPDPGAGALRLVFAGTPAPALPALRALLDSSHEVVAVVTRPDAAAGRGRQSRRSPVGQLADGHGIEVLTPARPRSPEFLERLASLAPDCCPVVAYGALVPRAALDIPRHGWVNLHFSLLPAWRGAAPVQAALLHGDEVTGASTFLLEEGLDTGPVYGVVTETVRPRDTSGDLLSRLSESGARLLVATLDGIADGSLTARPQPADGISLAPKITVEDAQVDWTKPAVHVDRQVRACTPAPGAWTTLAGTRLNLGPVTPVDDGPSLAPGELSAGKRQVLVGTGTVPVELGSVQAPGKRAMPGADWARGLHLDGHAQLGSTATGTYHSAGADAAGTA
jgi:methionyl-tRNA formyltransferase